MDRQSFTRRQMLSFLGVGGAISVGLVGTGQLATSNSENLESIASKEIIGHRGANGLAPQNSRKGIKLAQEYGCDGVELDVQKTKDGELILFHDPVFALATDNGYGLVEETPYEKVKTFTIDGTPILTLEEGLDIVSQTDLDLYLELKSEGILTDVLETVANFELIQQTTIISLDEPYLDNAPVAIPTGFISTAPIEDSVQTALSLGCDAVGTHYSPIQQSSFINEAHNNDLDAIIWSLVDTKTSIKDALFSDADIVMVNRPDIVADIRSDYQAE